MVVDKPAPVLPISLGSPSLRWKKSDLDLADNGGSRVTASESDVSDLPSRSIQMRNEFTIESCVTWSGGGGGGCFLSRGAPLIGPNGGGGGVVRRMLM